MSDDSLSMELMLKVGEGIYPLKFSATETVVMQCDGVETYKTIRNVEYTVKDQGDHYAIKRKVVKTQKVPSTDSIQGRCSFPDITSKLLSGILKPGQVKKRELPKWIPCKREIRDGKRLLVIDKLALAGGNVEERAMRDTLKFQTAKETLCYKNETGHGLKYLDAIVSEVRLTDSSRKEEAHDIRVLETIKL